MSIPGLTDSEHASLTDQAIADVKTRVPSSFTVGGKWDGKTVSGGVTFDRHWKNGFGFTAYAKAWWNDLPVSVGMKSVTVTAPQGEAGFNLEKKF